MRYLLITGLAAAVAVALLAGRRVRRSAPMPDAAEQHKSRRIAEIYAQAMAKIERLRKERTAIVDRLAERADALRIAEEKKKLDTL